MALYRIEIINVNANIVPHLSYANIEHPDGVLSKARKTHQSYKFLVIRGRSCGCVQIMGCFLLLGFDIQVCIEIIPDSHQPSESTEIVTGL